jgi:transposase-like protein
MHCPECDEAHMSRQGSGWRCPTCAYYLKLEDATTPFERPLQPLWTCTQESYPVYGTRYVIRAEAFLFGKKLGTSYAISEDDVIRCGDRLAANLDYVVTDMQRRFEAAVAQWVLYGVLP